MSPRPILTLLLALVLAACSKFGGNGAKWQGDAQQARSITAGMSQDQVRSVLGAPSTTQVMKAADQSLTAWYYVGAKDNVNVVFNTEGRVTTVGLNGDVIVQPAE